MKDIYVIIAGGGRGERFSSTQKKQFMMLENKPILQHSVDFFIAYPLVKSIALVLPQEDINNYTFQHPLLRCVAGGASRAESVQNGFLSFGKLSDEACVLVHDAARPFLTQALVDRVVDAVARFGSGIPALPITDTVKEVQGHSIIKTCDRHSLRLVQTPQGAQWSWFEKAYQSTPSNLSRITDESMLFEASGLTPQIVDGEAQNIKITTPQDVKNLSLGYGMKNL